MVIWICINTEKGRVLDEGPLLNFRQLHYMSIAEEAIQTSNPRWD